MSFILDLFRQKSRDVLRLGLQSAFAATLCFVALEAIGLDENLSVFYDRADCPA